MAFVAINSYLKLPSLFLFCFICWLKSFASFIIAKKKEKELWENSSKLFNLRRVFNDSKHELFFDFLSNHSILRKVSQGDEFCIRKCREKNFSRFCFLHLSLPSQKSITRNIFTDVQRQFPWWCSFVIEGNENCSKTTAELFFAFAFALMEIVMWRNFSSQTISSSFVWDALRDF